MFRPSVPRPDARWILACHLVLLLVMVCWDRGHVVWRSPSVAFIDHDIDGDRWISREEWESRYGTSAASRAVLDFEGHDCDHDGRLTWQEFYTVVRRQRQCGRSSLEWSHQQAQRIAAEAEGGLAIITDKDLQLARVSLARDRRKLVVARFHEHYTEQAWPAGKPYPHALACGEAEWVEIPEVSQDFRRLSQIAILSQGWRPAVHCSLMNRSFRTLTFLELRIVTATGNGRAEEVHGKTLWVPPGESRGFRIFPSPTRPVTGVTVLDVRTTRD